MSELAAAVSDTLKAKEEGKASFLAGNYQAALDKYQESLALTPQGDSDLPKLLTNCAMTCLKIALWTEAQNFAERSIALDAKWAKGYLWKAVALAQGGREDRCNLLLARAFCSTAIYLEQSLKSLSLMDSRWRGDFNNLPAERTLQPSDSALLNSSIVSSEHQENVLILKEGDYILSDALVMSQGCTCLVGLGEVRVTLPYLLVARSRALLFLENIEFQFTSADGAGFVADDASKVLASNCTFNRIAQELYPCVSASGKAHIFLRKCKVSCAAGGGCQLSNSGGVFLVECEIRGCGQAALGALSGGTFRDKGSLIADNERGALFWKASGNIHLQDTIIHTTRHEGVRIMCTDAQPSPLEHPQQKQLVRLENCQIHHCSSYGIYCDGGGASITNCRMFENAFHGCLIKNGAEVSLRDCHISRNRCVGVYLGYNGDAPVSIVNNTMVDNWGAGFFQVPNCPPNASLLEKQKLGAAGLFLDTTAPHMEGNDITNNGENMQLTNESICSFCKKSGKMKCCKQCLSAYFCSRECSVAAWKGHKRECGRMADGHVILDKFEALSQDANAKVTLVPNWNPNVRAPKKSKNLALKREDVIIKVQSIEGCPDPNQLLAIYDKDRIFQVFARNAALYQLILDKGSLSSNHSTAKKIFLRARVEPLADGSGEMRLRINTAELAPFQPW